MNARNGMLRSALGTPPNIEGSEGTLPRIPKFGIILGIFWRIPKISEKNVLLPKQAVCSGWWRQYASAEASGPVLCPCMGSTRVSTAHDTGDGIDYCSSHNLFSVCGCSRVQNRQAPKRAWRRPRRSRGEERLFPKFWEFSKLSQILSQI